MSAGALPWEFRLEFHMPLASGQRSRTSLDILPPSGMAAATCRVVSPPTSPTKQHCSLPEVSPEWVESYAY